MRKMRPDNSQQYNLPFADKPEIAKPKIEPTTAAPKEPVKMPTVAEITKKYTFPEPDPDDDKDESYYRGKDWKGATPDEKRRANDSLWGRKRA